MGKASIPRYDRRKDRGFPGTQEPHERDPEGNPIQPVGAAFSGNLFPAVQYDMTGGGVTEPSVQDEATDLSRIVEHGSTDPRGEVAQLDDAILYDEEYGYAGLGGKKATEKAFDPSDVHRMLEQFAASSYQGAMLTRDVATAAVYNTYLIVGNDALPVLGGNWARRRALVKAPKTNTANVMIGNQNSLSNAAIGAGVYIMEPGDVVEILNTDSLSAVLLAGTAGQQLLSVMDESYER